jgi:hypothetical protein
MQITTAILAIISTATIVVQAEDGVIRSPIIRNPQQGNVLEVARKRYQRLNEHLKLNKRADPSNAALYNDQGSQYLIEVGIGTPPQNFAVTLDTGR